MESKAVGFSVVVVVLGILSAAAAFAGEITRVKANDVSIVDGSCVYPSSPAFALGIIAAALAIVTQIFISVTLGGCRCCLTDPNATPLSKLFSVLSRVATVVAVVLLLAAAGLNHRQGGEVDSAGYVVTCYVVKPGIFAAGGILALLSAVFAVAGYATVTPAAKPPTNPAIAISVLAPATAAPAPAGANGDPDIAPVQFHTQTYPTQQYASPRYPTQQYASPRYPIQIMN